MVTLHHEDVVLEQPLVRALKGASGREVHVELLGERVHELLRVIYMPAASGYAVSVSDAVEPIRGAKEHGEDELGASLECRLEFGTDLGEMFERKMRKDAPSNDDVHRRKRVRLDGGTDGSELQSWVVAHMLSAELDVAVFADAAGHGARLRGLNAHVVKALESPGHEVRKPSAAASVVEKL